MAHPSPHPDSDIPYISMASFAADGIAHGFFGRKGGVSNGIFAGLNCGPGSGDNPENVKTNRALVAKVLGGMPENLLSLYQIHSGTCLGVSEPWKNDRPQADGMVTDKPGVMLAILTADCAPVLFCGQTKEGKKIIGAAHAGWRGAVGGILESTVAKMIKEYGALPESIRAAIGPCIHKKSYEVSDEFYQTFMKQDPENERFFQNARKAGHFMFDLAGYCAARLAAFGVRHVQIAEKDTYADEASYFSFRRATHRGEADYGRQVSVVMIVDGGR